MWEIFIGVALAAAVLDLIIDWRRRRDAKRHLAELRKHSELHHKWDAVRGRWGF
jgi:hypothetical protein